MSEFTGRVYDVDFNSRAGWCQVLLENPSAELVVRTADEHLQALLSAGLATGSHSTSVFYDETRDGNWATGVRLAADPGVPSTGVVSVVEVGPDSPLFRVQLNGPAEETFLVLDPRLLAIVLQAMELPDVRFEHAVDGGILYRAKLNRPTA